MNSLNARALALFVAMVMMCFQAMASPTLPTHYYVVVSRSLSQDGMKEAFSLAQATLHVAAKGGDAVTVLLGGESPEELVTLQVPKELAQANRHVMARLDEAQGYSARIFQRLRGLQPANQDANIDIPKAARFIGQRLQSLRNQEHPVLILVGSPMHQERRKEEEFASMRDSLIPNDDFIVSDTPYSVGWGQGQALQGVPVHHVFVNGSAPCNNLHDDGLRRFWGLYWSKLGARLVTFGNDRAAPTRFANFALQPQEYEIKPEGKLIMRSAIRTYVPTILSEEAATTASKVTGDTRKVTIALQWADDSDLDLHVAAYLGSQGLFQAP